MTLLAVLPVALPLATAGLLLVTRRRPGLAPSSSLAGALALAGAGGLLVVETFASGRWVVALGGWAAPHGIVLSVDVFGALMVLVTGLVASAALVARRFEPAGKNGEPLTHALVHLLLFGVCGAFLTGDLFNLYVCFEVMLVASFALMATGEGAQSRRGTVFYLVASLLGSMLFLLAAGLVYGASGTLNLDELARRAPGLVAGQPALWWSIAALLLVAFGLKAGVFPLFSWLPRSYPVLSPSLAALFAGLLTKVGIVALARLALAVMPAGLALDLALAPVAGITMIVGALAALAQRDLRRVLSFHIVSQIGYMVMGLVLLGAADPAVRAAGLAATVFYVVHHILVKSALFLGGGLMARAGGGFDLATLGDLRRRQPALALVFAIPALSLAGLPPLSGFWAKLALIRVGLDDGRWLLVAAALAAGLLTLLSMLKLWNEAFWKPRPESAPVAALGKPALLPIAALASVTIAIGVWPQALWELALAAAFQVGGTQP
jgi:multicomponent Na+:H+ antiporter subunit D